MSTQQELKQEGNIHFQNNNFKKAIEFYTLAIEKDAFCDEAAPILSNRSLCYFNIGKYKEAYEDAGCCCGIRPDWAKGFARRGTAAEELKEWQIALESYNEYLKLDKSDEMNIKMKQRNVKKIVDVMEKKEQEREKELRKIDERLSAMQDGTEEKQKMVYSLFASGWMDMDIFKVELGVKHGVDLGRKWHRDMKALRVEPYSNAASAEADRVCRADFSMWHDKIDTGAAAALKRVVMTRSRADDSDFEQTALLAKQRVTSIAFSILSTNNTQSMNRT